MQDFLPSKDTPLDWEDSSHSEETKEEYEELEEGPRDGEEGFGDAEVKDDEVAEEGPLRWEYTTVEEDYFDDALFIGDSRTVGLMEYGGLQENATFYASTGLTVYKLFSAEIVPVEDCKDNITIEEALSQKQFSKIYLMVGINEMGTGTVESFVAAYEEAVEHIQELQPDAIIYIQAILRVSTARSAQGDYIHNEGIDARNEGISQLADDQKVFYLDVNPLISDEEGGLIQDYTFDGVHLKAKYIAIWKEFLMEHAVRFY
ncbi:MAG: hypothetical protein J1E65_07230 [Lachnospiraceae bacterium]|nr:hypothetical protein [Lachnospiraceae bacterium]